VPEIKIDHITSQEFSHVFGNRRKASTNEEMKVVRQERPGIDKKVPSPAQTGKSFYKILAIGIRPIDVRFLNTATDDVMQGTGSI